ncbi:hypothetical protein, conserved [Trypanosoma brucei gambiense DAL972]|uniref:SH3 domain-containing protein n=1 Tax=Trypanosoma brucei gambiense (strain MHOM/CI/86/DAL972) TaxID=679716 RepID=D0A7A4_TRYB9|nr:hypothetical protein, conserved [Trypanosoma brucei gambiense DAL972]CBH17555.1 hypothetical protein, conserved [Trypanosoma brucei gambiense DAL972]|eukprot:XP_011779819.1 hypothetical protein, conserved [Trypanosoma brucei gambiense DAL972]
MSIACALDDYEGPGRHYLRFREGDLIFVMENHPSGWWTGKTLEGVRGLLPSSLMEEVDVGCPSEELLRDFFVLQSARGVKFERPPYVPPPLSGRDALPQDENGSDELNIVQLLEGIQFQLIQRDASCRRLLECVNDMERDSIRYHGATHFVPKEQTSDYQGGEQEVHCLNSADKTTMVNLVNELSSLLVEIKSRECPAPTKFPSCVAELFSGKEAYVNENSLYRELLYERLRQCHREVRDTGVELSALSKQIQEARYNICQERQRLVRRIVIRDAKVRALLSYWAEQAEEIKMKYREEKRRYSSLSASNSAEEEERLRQAIAEGRERYIAAEDEHNHWEREAKKLKVHLQQRAELEEMSRALRQATESEMLLRRAPTPNGTTRT